WCPAAAAARYVRDATRAARHDALPRHDKDARHVARSRFAAHARLPAQARRLGARPPAARHDSMTWKPVDCHAHSTMSDGALDVAAIVERARELGVRPSISDHVSHDVAKAIAAVD